MKVALVSNPIHDCSPIVCAALLSKAFELLRRSTRMHDYDFVAEAKSDDPEWCLKKPAEELQRVYTEVHSIYHVKKQRWYEGNVPNQIEALLEKLEEVLRSLKSVIKKMANPPADGNTQAILRDVRGAIGQINDEARTAFKRAVERLEEELSSACSVTDAASLASGTKTVVSVDLSQYGRQSGAAEALFDAEGVLQFNQKIEKFLLDLARDLDTKYRFIHTGDGAIFIFDAVEVAVRFAEAVHRDSQKANHQIADANYQAHYRVGACTGQVCISEVRGRYGAQGEFRAAGTVIARSVRLQSRAETGEVLLSERTFSALEDGSPLKTSYEGCAVEELEAKPHEAKIRGRRKAIVGRAPWDGD